MSSNERRSRRNLVVGAATLLAVAAFAGATLPAQPDPGPDCCPCEREAAYVANLAIAKDGGGSGRITRLRSGIENERERGQRALIECIRQNLGSR